MSETPRKIIYGVLFSGVGFGLYQILFDFMGRHSGFWAHYGEDLRMKYIFFVQEGKVTRIPFADFLVMTQRYVELTTADGK